MCGMGRDERRRPRDAHAHGTRLRADAARPRGADSRPCRDRQHAGRRRDTLTFFFAQSGSMMARTFSGIRISVIRKAKRPREETFAGYSLGRLHHQDAWHLEWIKII